jgi:hypothetical protein
MSFEVSRVDHRDARSRPSVETVNSRADEFVFEAERTGRPIDREVRSAWELWANGDSGDYLASEEQRHEHYPGWSNEDFAQLLKRVDTGVHRYEAERTNGRVRRLLGLELNAPLGQVIERLAELETKARKN